MNNYNAYLNAKYAFKLNIMLDSNRHKLQKEIYYNKERAFAEY